MAEQLQPVSISSPGHFGINRVASVVDLDPQWALDATNCVIDRSGRIAARNGWLKLTVTPIASSPNIESMAEYLKTDGSTQIISGAGNAIYSGTEPLTSVYSTSISANRWQMVNFNNYLWLFQRGHAPLRWDGTTMATIASLGGTGTAPQGNCVLAAYGRLWVADTATDKVTVSFSDTLIGQNWSAGASGTLNLSQVWTNGMDSIVALASHQGFLIIFGRKSILIYSGAATTPASNLTLVEHIKGIGCISRDSVWSVGDDIWFLSDSGVRSLVRSINAATVMPVSDVTKNIRDDVVNLIKNESNLEDVRAGYHEVDGYYVITFPSKDTSVWIDTRMKMEDESYRCTYWNQITPRAYAPSISRTMYIGKAGVVGKIFGYQDNGSAYTMTYYTPWLSFQAPAVQKILKKIHMNVTGSSNTTFSIKWGYDYQTAQFSNQQVITGGVTAEYNIAQYNIDEYSSGIVLNELNTPGMSTGKMIQLGITCVVNGTQLAINKIDALAKPGRMI